jgi:hypothetical protein
MIRTPVVIGIIMLISSSASAQSIIVEAENYLTYYNAGGTTIYVTSCSAASGGLAIEGFDWTGDWIEYAVNIPVAGAYADSVRAAGLIAVESEFQSTIFGGAPGGGNLVSTFNMLGLGIG